MINVDGNLFQRKDLWLDLRNRLPFADGSARLIYCSHVLEHLYPEDAIRLLREMCRVLAQDGVVRLAVPSFEHCLVIADGGRSESTWPRQFDHPLSQAINYLYCDGQHKYAYCFDNLRAFVLRAGFAEVVDQSDTDGVAERQYAGLAIGGEPAGSLVVELRKQSAAYRKPHDKARAA
jgi:predicted SAM-dependent methyltransferase